MSKTLLTYDRGDRKPFMDHCQWQCQRFVTSYNNHIFVIHQPKNNQPDLTERVKTGYDEAVRTGSDWLIMIESDDYYAPEYLHKVYAQMNDADFIGSEFTIYYNLRNRTWERSHHVNHSSLFCTAFRVSAMKDFKWHLADKVFLDRDLWIYAKRYRRVFTDLPAIGIKHGIGLVGGKGHKGVFPNKDPQFEWLKARVDERSYEFYSKLELK